MKIVRNDGLLKTLWLGVLVAIASSVTASEIENPYKNSNVGDWAKYKKVLDIGLSSSEETLKITVIAKTDQEVSLEIETSSKNEEPTKRVVVLKLDAKWLDQSIFPEGTTLMPRQNDSGDETFFLAGHTRKTHRVEYDVAMKESNESKIAVNAKLKVWTCKEVGAGIVKIHADAGILGSLKIELLECGSRQDSAKETQK